MQRLAGKVAIVTGSGRGLGRGLALALAEEGAAIVVHSTGGERAPDIAGIQDARDADDRKVNTAAKVADEIRSVGGRAVAVTGRLGGRDIAEKLVATAVAEFGRLDILVNNAAVAVQGTFETYDDNQFDETVLANLRGPWMNSQVAVNYWIKSGIRGRIINISSAAGIYGSMVHAAYSATKGALNVLTMSLARELGPKYGITANAVSPVARTDMFDGIRPTERRDQIADFFASISNINRMGDPKDVAPIIVFLASDESYYVTGQIISATGFGHVITRY